MMNQQISNTGMARAIYILYLVSLVLPLTSLIGVVLAYVYQDKQPGWLASHFRYQIRTFWIGLLYSLVGVLSVFVLIGYLILLFVLVWLVVRCAKGMQRLDRQEEVQNVTGWMF
jgi:uncharacterized membrane protein